jgi:hypothetical protein
MANKRLTHAARYFAKVAALNELIDKGSNEAKDAVLAKVHLANSSTLKTQKALKKKNKGNKTDLLDSRAMLPGSYESGKRRR